MSVLFFEPVSETGLLLSSLLKGRRGVARVEGECLCLYVGISSQEGGRRGCQSSTM